ncbi:phage head closure protein [Allorhizobium borbori]|uniref:SPP1 family predicted phage head-tail adaptor n=1 Tax=Allorhizobium borbori TaxID=485907 RepID=A0A7W6P3H8_9HYPH|nr:phage head closure protein [Allorhizobium borbori]MBB4104859.1 SPP1 family predicted phage head-tail adaptor [Allorhizobium borbori]
MPLVFFDPGQMTARLDLQRPVSSPDGQGGAAVSFETVAALWARIEPMNHALTEDASQREVILTHRIWIARRDGVQAGMRFVRGARVFAIRAVQDPDETQRYLVCHCEEDGA